MNNLCMEKEVRRYIEDEMEYDSVKNNKDGVLDYLKSLTDEDMDKIADDIINDEWFTQQLNETINYYLYHYKKWEKEEE